MLRWTAKVTLLNEIWRLRVAEAEAKVRLEETWTRQATPRPLTSLDDTHRCNLPALQLSCRVYRQPIASTFKCLFEPSGIEILRTEALVNSSRDQSTRGSRPKYQMCGPRSHKLTANGSCSIPLVLDLQGSPRVPNGSDGARHPGQRCTACCMPCQTNKARLCNSSPALWRNISFTWH